MGAALRRKGVRMENEVIAVNRVDEIRDRLKELEGERMKVKANMGRSRIVERTGTLVQAHPSLFVVEVDERSGRKARQSYQYVDIADNDIVVVEGTNL
jgi:uncharacterized protein Veg